ncbi:class I SAM-dependent methyltransferase [Pleurocapsales cyanobacterium LEGE 06147]|nr:class I SAM-dependent methyltransferase [Pleurocapsales cyanobacterium LEGE 06147]
MSTSENTALHAKSSRAQRTQIQPKIGLASRLVNIILAIKPLANFAKQRARQMMIQRAENIGVPWRENVRQLSDRDWEKELISVQNPELQYPDYYLSSFHAYERGNLSWEAAWEVESAAYAVHAKIWSDTGAQGDSQLRQSYHQIVKQQVSIQPQDILDLGCSVGMSTFALQAVYPQAKITGVDLSPYFLAVAKYRSEQYRQQINWLHRAAESTNLPDASFDLVSACLVFHELPQTAAKKVIAEAHRLLRPGGYLTIMDMNPESEVYRNMPPYVLTLLKSTEPYLDRYFTLDLEKVLLDTGFCTPTITPNSPRHRTIVAQSLTKQ